MARSMEESVQKNYAAAGGRNAEALPWAAIIQLLMSLFGGGCPAKRAKRWARLFPEATKKMLDDKLKADGYFSNGKDRAAAVEAAYKTFLSSGDADIDSLR